MATHHGHPGDEQSPSDFENDTGPEYPEYVDYESSSEDGDNDEIDHDIPHSSNQFPHSSDPNTLTSGDFPSDVDSFAGTALNPFSGIYEGYTDTEDEFDEEFGAAYDQDDEDAYTEYTLASDTSSPRPHVHPHTHHQPFHNIRDDVELDAQRLLQQRRASLLQPQHHIAPNPRHLVPPHPSLASSIANSQPFGVVDLTQETPSTTAMPPTSRTTANIGTKRARSSTTPAEEGSSSTKRRRTSTTTSQPQPSKSTSTEVEEVNLVDGEDDLAAALQKQRADQVKAQDPGRDGDKPMRLSALTCVICMDTPTDLTATGCGHVFCHTCLMEALIAGENRSRPGEPKRSQCPVCRKTLSRQKKTDIIPLALMRRALATQPRKAVA